MSQGLLRLQLHGPFVAKMADGRDLPVRGAKISALIALLACAPGMTRSRAWLIDTLWGRVDQNQGRASLRQALFVLKKNLGDQFDLLFEVTADRVGLRQEAVLIEGSPAHGEFLEGMDIGEDGFEDWLRSARLAAGEKAAASNGAWPAPGGALKPLVAVLPLRPLRAAGGGDPVGDAIAQELIRVLSRSQLIDLVSHLSSRRMDTRVLDIDQIRETLDVDFVASGNWGEAGGQLLVDLDFNDTRSGKLIWSERYRSDLRAFFAGDESLIYAMGQDVVRSILSTSVHLGTVNPLPNVATHTLMMSGIGLMHHMAHGHFRRAREHLTEVARRSPQHSVPRAWLAQWHLLNVYQGWSANPGTDVALAEDHVSAALEANPQCAFSLAMDGNIKTVLKGEFEAAEAAFAASFAVNANSPMACQLRSVLHSFRGEGDVAVQLTERARRLSPCDPRGHFFDALGAAAYLASEDFDRAVELADAAIAATPRHLSAHRSKVVGLQLGGHHLAASEAARALRRLDPEFTVEKYLGVHPATRFATGRAWAQAMADAGVPMR